MSDTDSLSLYRSAYRFPVATGDTPVSEALRWLSRIVDGSVTTALLTLPHRLGPEAERELADELARVLSPASVVYVHGAGAALADQGWSVRFIGGKLWTAAPWRCPQPPAWVQSLDPWGAGDSEFPPQTIEAILSALPTPDSIVLDVFPRAGYITSQLARRRGLRVLTMAPSPDAVSDEPGAGCPAWALDSAFVDQFQSRLTPAEGGCMLWTGGLGGNGYGRIKVAGRDEYAHRVSWILAHRRPIPPSMTIGHRTGCERRCCAPPHLRLASLSVNVQERWVGRRRP